mmetsp:Transcript_40044/g.80799  ORF Transcript_40044/g.80799 Transcript_40044/m.80799 type:complete len:245 (+) Transcript_40044:199-933(+)
MAIACPFFSISPLQKWSTTWRTSSLSLVLRESPRPMSTPTSFPSKAPACATSRFSFMTMARTSLWHAATTPVTSPLLSLNAETRLRSGTGSTPHPRRTWTSLTASCTKCLTHHRLRRETWERPPLPLLLPPRAPRTSQSKSSLHNRPLALPPTPQQRSSPAVSSRRRCTYKRNEEARPRSQPATCQASRTRPWPPPPWPPWLLPPKPCGLLRTLLNRTKLLLLLLLLLPLCRPSRRRQCRQPRL